MWWKRQVSILNVVVIGFVLLTVLVLLNVVNNEQSTKQICTRALWCLANQNLQSSILLPNVSE